MGPETGDYPGWPWWVLTAITGGEGRVRYRQKGRKVTLEAETGACGWAQECQQPPEGGRGKGQLSPGGPRGRRARLQPDRSLVLLTLDF